MRPCLCSRRASLALEVVLPEPCKPTIRTQLGLPLNCRPALGEPSKPTSSSWMILMICWPGWMLCTTSCPRDLALTRSMKSRADLEIDIGLQQRHAHLAQGVADVGLGDFAQAAQIAEGVLKFLAQRVEHALKLEDGPGVDKVRGIPQLRTATAGGPPALRLLGRLVRGRAVVRGGVPHKIIQHAQVAVQQSSQLPAGVAALAAGLVGDRLGLGAQAGDLTSSRC